MSRVSLNARAGGSAADLALFAGEDRRAVGLANRAALVDRLIQAAAEILS